jgi:hypothetical protein
MIFRGQTDPDTGAPNGDWNDAQNWEGGAVPGPNDPATFDRESPACFLSADCACDRLQLTGYRGVIDTRGYGLLINADLKVIMGTVAAVDLARTAMLTTAKEILAGQPKNPKGG